VTNVPPNSTWALAREAQCSSQKHPQTWSAKVTKNSGRKYIDKTANKMATDNRPIATWRIKVVLIMMRMAGGSGVD
jgi:hypothetical protein